VSYRCSNRHQTTLLPSSIEDYISDSDPVRAYDSFIDQLDLKAIGIKIDNHKVGNSSYDPVSMLKLLVYGYSYGVFSSRKLERALHHNLSFIWLMGGLQPDYRSIARFRRENKKSLEQILKYSARMCIDLELVDGNVLFVDGSKFRANASIDNKWNELRCTRVLNAVEKRIEEILTECESIDNAEQSLDSMVLLQSELQKKNVLQARVKKIAEQLNNEPRLKKSSNVTVNTVDSDCKPMHTKKGSYSGYNVQAVTDGKNGIVVSADVVNDRNDLCQLNKQIVLAEENIQEQCETVVADTGYSNIAAIKPLLADGREVLVPNQEQSAHKNECTGFEKRFFVFTKATDSYTCPAGYQLVRKKTDTKLRKIHYSIADSSHCNACVNFGKCTSSKSGRTIIRYFDDELREQLAKEFTQQRAKDIYVKRKEMAERPFAYIKHNKRYNQFLLRGLAGVRAEFSLLCSSFNIKRAITEMGGVQELITAMKATCYSGN